MDSPARPLLPFAVLLFVACVAHAEETATRPPAPSIDAAEIGEIRPGSGFLNGYLAATEWPDSLALLPAPPSADAPAQRADDAAFRTQDALRNGPRGRLAQEDAELKFPQAAQVFSCALGIPVSELGTPHLNMLLRRTLVDAGSATYKAKNRYQRERPFAAFKTASCTPDREAALIKDGSYPSGHAAVGWAWALVLAEIAPDRADALLQRGHAFGQSRGVCGVHWQSDIEAGRLVGAAAVARLHANATFTAQLGAARTELRQARARREAPARDCAAEAAALAQPMP